MDNNYYFRNLCGPFVKKSFVNRSAVLPVISRLLLFLLMNGLLLFVFPDTDILANGYATLDKFFELAPWILLLLIPAITMRSMADEFRMGTYEILQNSPAFPRAAGSREIPGLSDRRL